MKSYQWKKTDEKEQIEECKNMNLQTQLAKEICLSCQFSRT